MGLAPPYPAEPGQPYYLYLAFTDFESGSPVDPASLVLDITYGSQATADTAGPFDYTGASAEASGVIWRTGTGAYSFRWDVPVSGLLPGVYAATWTAVYGAGDDEFQAYENFAVNTGAPFAQPPSGDTGFWTGSIAYQPSWASVPFTIPLGSVDGNGVAWVLKGLKGWDGPPAVGQVIQRSADHGGWPSAAYYGPRLMTLSVEAKAPTQALRDQAAEQLVQAVPVSDLATFTYNEPVPKLAYVRQNGSANITMDKPTLVDVVFSIPLVAPDPRKYATVPFAGTATLPAPVINPLTLPVTLPAGFPGSVPAIDSAVTCVNAGTFETRPVITVTGPITGPQVVNAATGQTVTFTGLSLAATDQLVLYTDSRQSFLNGAFYGADTNSAWWTLNQGTTQVYLAGQNFAGGATITVAYSSAWL
jgi:Phage tail protein